MKNLLVLFCCAILLVMTGCVQKVDIGVEKLDVKVVVDQFAQAIESEDMELFANIIAHDADMVNFGTDAGERWVGWEPLKESIAEQFASFENTKLTVKDQVIHVNPAGKVAWFSEIADWNMEAQGQPVHLKGCRITGVLEKRNGNWVFVQFHFSLPVSGQAAQY
jgi:uncharacterized protein (TIGR02246 family)